MDSKEKRTKLMGEGPIKSSLITLAIPSMLAMVVMAIYNFADTYYVGLLNDTNAMAAVSIGFPLFIILGAFGMMIGIGASSCAGRKIGAGDIDAASKIGGLAVRFGLIVSVFVMILGTIFLDGILTFLGATPDILPYAKSYTSWLVAGSVFSIMNMCFNNLFRCEGAAKISMTTLLIGSIVNIILDPIFMFVFDMGLTGAAIATVIGQASSTLFAVYYHSTGKSIIRINKETLSQKITDNKTIVLDIIKIGLPVFIMQILTSISIGIMNTAASTFGPAPLASIGIVSKIYSMFTQLVAGYTQAFLPFAAFNIGAKQYKRVKDGLIFSIIILVAFGLLASTIFKLFPEMFIQVFTSDPAVISLGVNQLTAQTYMLGGTSFIIIMMSLFQAMGRVKEAGILSIGRQGLFLIPLVLILPKAFANYAPSFLKALVPNEMENGLYGVMFAQPIADLVTFVLCLFLAVKTVKDLNRLAKTQDETVA